MNRSYAAKTLLFVSLTLGFSCEGKAPFPELSCGRYQIEGTLKRNRLGLFVLVQDFKTYSPREFVVLGGSAQEKMRQVNRHLTADVYVPNLIGDEKQPIVFLRNLGRPTPVEKADSFKKIGDAKCRDKQARP